MVRRGTTGESYSNKALFERSRDPVFVLNRRRRLRYANAACETLLGQTLADLYNLHCIRDRRAAPLAQALAPPPEALAGLLATTRRPAPPARIGPPWWDISFLPLAGQDGLLGILGRIVVVGVASKAKPPAVPEAVLQLRQRLKTRHQFSVFDSEAPAVLRAVAQARVAAKNFDPVLLLGEESTGKCPLARCIHHQGVAAERTFLPVDCAGLIPAALESLLFGPAGLERPERVGTVYLRDVAFMPREMQARMAEWMARHSSDGPRVVGSLTESPADVIAEGRLMDALAAALDVQRIHLPPLRERIVDLPRRASRVWERARDAGVNFNGEVTAAGWNVLRAYHWPGNLREFESVAISAAAKAGAGDIDETHFPQYMRLALKWSGAAETAPRVFALDSLTEQFQRRLMLLALRQAHGQRAEAGRLLGLSRTELWRRMSQLKIGEDDWRTVLPREGGDAPSEDRRP